MQVFLTTIVVLVISIGLAQGTCSHKQIKQCGPTAQCKRTCNNIKLLTIKPVCETSPCVEGCFCPPSAPIETWNSNFIMKCIPSVEDCSCPRGQAFTRCSEVVSPTCNSPVVRNQPEQCGFPHCQCIKEKPIWHRGKCITAQQCTCPDRCVTRGCSVCNKCRCKLGRSVNCETKSCPDVQTPEGVKELMKGGCWRLSPSGEQCVFYSPCLDTLGNIKCGSDIEAHQGITFCSDCHNCQCSGSQEICNKDENCEHLIRTKGCWSLVKQKCIYISPCPENSAKACEGLPSAIKMCKMCSKCECVYGAKICSGSGICPDPRKHGCYIMRKYVSEEKGCYFVSPCPHDMPSRQLMPCGQFDVSVSFCYIYNGNDDICEFISPCPLISTCRNGDIICNKCNECKCKDGMVRCRHQTCGNPIPDGCWVLRGRTCVFLSPCPNDVVLHGDRFCRTNGSVSFCRGCNICNCTPDGVALCMQKACPQITEDMGCYLAVHGRCVFMAPCPMAV